MIIKSLECSKTISTRGSDATLLKTASSNQKGSWSNSFFFSGSYVSPWSILGLDICELTIHILWTRWLRITTTITKVTFYSCVFWHLTSDRFRVLRDPKEVAIVTNRLSRKGSLVSDWRVQKPLSTRAVLEERCHATFNT